MLCCRYKEKGWWNLNFETRSETFFQLWRYWPCYISLGYMMMTMFILEQIIKESSTQSCRCFGPCRESLGNVLDISYNGIVHLSRFWGGFSTWMMICWLFQKVWHPLNCFGHKYVSNFFWDIFCYFDSFKLNVLGLFVVQIKEKTLLY